MKYVLILSLVVSYDRILIYMSTLQCKCFHLRIEITIIIWSDENIGLVLNVNIANVYNHSI